VSYRAGGGTHLNLYETQYAGQAGHTVAQWHVEDVETEVRELKARGVSFQVYEDMPGAEWDGEVATLGGMMKSAWFTDTEGNIMCLDGCRPSCATRAADRLALPGRCPPYGIA
jgi:hypothetical protein